jgi:hypothetical protein
LLTLLWLFGMAGSLHALQTPTNTAITVTVDGALAGSVSSGTVVVLTASVTQPSMEHPNVTLGTVNFCDATATYCEDSHLIGSAQVTSHGTATFKFRPAPGQHTYKAVFHGTTGFASSTSYPYPLEVTGGPFATTTTIAQSGSAGDYTLMATVTSSGSPALSPAGTVDFLDTSNGNYLLASGTLTAGPSILSYAAPVGVSTGANSQPMWSVTADFNQDGIPDIAVIDFSNPDVYQYGNPINIFFGNADGTFTQQTPLLTAVADPISIVGGDLNGDGYPDLIMAVAGALNVFLNNGSGGFNSPVTYNLSYTDFAGNYVWDTPQALAVGDVNNDGHMDVVFPFGTYDDASTSSSTGPTVIGVPPGVIAVALGNGDGTLQFNGTAPYVPLYGTFNSNPSSIALADLTGNGNLDLITGSGTDLYLSVLAGNGDGTFQYATNSTTFTTRPAESESIVVADFNGDGKPDLAFGTGASCCVSIMLGNGDRTFQVAKASDGIELASTYEVGNAPTGMVTADLNGDGIPDLATANFDDNTVTVLLGNGDGTFQGPLWLGGGNTSSQTALTFPAGTGPYSIQAANFSGNGIPSLAVVDETSTSVSMLVNSLTTSATTTLTGVSPVGPVTNTDLVDANYLGDSYYSSGTSATTSLTPQPVPTTLALVSNVSTVTVGGQVTLTATVSPASAQDHAPSGTMTFYSNGNNIGTATVSNGVATLKPHLDAVQTNTITASYAGDSNFIGSTSTALVQIAVQKAATTLTLQVCDYASNWICPATTSTYGGEIQVTATLSPYSVTGGGSSDGETVTFYNNGTSIGTATLTFGSATLYLDQTAAGVYSFTASYSGDASFVASTTSTPSIMTVAKAASSMSLTTNPVTTSPFGQQIILTATFNTYPYNVSGETVTFYNGTTVVGTGQLSSSTPTAFLRLNNLPVGNYNFKVSYPGDSNFLSSSSTAPVVAVQPLPTSLSVSAPSTIIFSYGTPITVQVFLEPYAQGGSTTNGEPITLYQNGAVLGTAAVSGGMATFTVNAPPVGTDAYTASYAGDTSFAPSTAAAAYVSVQQAATTMGIATNALHGIGATGQPVTMTATISSNLATGTVIFYENGNDIGDGTLTNGVATLVVNGLPEGNYTFGASYGGDTNFTGSTASPTASLTVLQATTLTLTTSPAHYAAPNQPVSIIVTISPSSIPGDNTNGQTVYIYNGTSQFGNATLSNGVGTYTPNNGLPEGTYSFTAVYDSDGILANATTATPVAFAVVTGQLFVVNTSADDAGTAANCTPQSSTTSNSTDSACSLRDALLAAAAAPEGASISFATSAFPAATTITLTNGGLTLPANTTLTGPTLNSGGANVTNLVTVNGNGSSIFQTSSTVFTVTGAGTAISNLTITGGWPYSNSVDITNGGGILNSGVLTLTNSTITNNGTFNSGGGIYNTGMLTVLGSTFSNNTAAADGFGSGGGIDNAGGTLTVINSTFANNTVRSGYGGGIAVAAGTATITNSTLTGNSVGGGGGGLSTVVSDGNGNPVNGGTLTLANTIVSGNNDFFSDIDDGGIAYTDKGGNIVGYINRTFTPVNDPSTLNLGPLDNYGGPTQTILPLPGSQVICAGSYLESPSQWAPPLTAINIDQRGYPNYNLFYGQLRYANGGNPLPSACFDSGAVQTNYQSVQFSQSSYAGVAGGAVVPTVVASVTENGVSRQAVPVTLNYSGPGNLSGNAATTVTGSGATFSNLSLDTTGSGSLGTSLIIAGTSYISASTSLRILPSLIISPGSESIYAAAGAPLSQTFSVSNGSGSYRLSSAGTLPPGVSLTPSGTSTGSGWTLSGTASQDGSYNFTLTATDVANSVITLSRSYTLEIAPATTTTLSASPASTAPLGQTVTLTATVSSPTANGTVSFFDGGTLLGSVGLSDGTPNVSTFAWTASTLGTHSFTAQFSGDATDAASTSNTVPYNVTLPNFVVNTTSDDAGSYTCATLAFTTGNTTDGNNGGNPGLCTLRDALNTASGVGAGNIYFDTTVFVASNLAANTIFPNIVANGSLTIPSNTTIQGLTSGDGATLTNLVTVDGGGSSVGGNGTIFVASGTSTAINNLNIDNGYASNGGSGGAIANGSFNGAASTTISGSTFAGNQAAGSGGAIYNAFGSTLTVVNSTFSSNSATGGNGGAIDNSNFYGCGATTVSNSTFYQNSAANGGNGYGGAINNDGNGPCQVTVNSSTMVGNSTDNSNPSDGFGGGGGGIYSQFLLYLANNVITGNTINGSGEDDLDDNFWESNYTAGNTFVTINIIDGNLVGTWNGYTKNGTSVTLAPLANYGGSTRTMIPLPGSVAICGGIAGGPGTDQRGDPLQPTGGYCPSGTVDSGAVQTNYALTFTTQPPSSASAGVAISPAPVVQLTESGAVAPFASSAVSMTDSAGLLTGTASASLSSGSATFNNLMIPSGAANDLLTATLALNPTVNVTAQASVGINVSGPEPAVSLSVTSVSFGSEPLGYSTAAQNVTLTNTGSATLTITSIRLTGANPTAFVSSNTCGASVAAGATCRIGVRFAPTVTGALSAAITLTDSAAGSPGSITLSGTGIAIPAASLTLSTNSLSFGSEPTGSSTAAQDVIVTNSGAGTIYFRSITLAGANPTSFVSSNTCAVTLAAGATCRIGVRFAPTVTGALSATITLTDNTGDSPESITLSGTGVADQTASLTLSTNNLSFGSEPIGYSSTSQTVTVTNSSAVTLYFQSITLGGANPTAFASSNTCGTSVAAGATCRIGVRFAPTVAAALSATITLIDNAGDSPESITLNGTGIAVPAASLTLTTNNLSFGSEPTGSSTAAQSVIVTNTGAATIYFQSITLAGTNPTSFVSSNTCGATLAAGATCRIGVRFAPTETGALSASITLSHNAGGSPQSIALNGTGQ